MQSWIWTKFDQYFPYVVFYPFVKFHDDPSFVRQLAAIFVSDFWRRMRARATSDLEKNWPIGFSCGDIPS